jgi:hypothetical protein
MSSTPVKSYGSPERPPDFEVRYRFYTAEEGGRKGEPRQHMRSDFLYHGDDPYRDGIYAIYPEFLNAAGNPFPEGPVPYNGVAHMFIFNPAMRTQVHCQRISVGVKGYFVEGPNRVAECEVTRLIGLRREDADSDKRP